MAPNLVPPAVRNLLLLVFAGFALVAWPAELCAAAKTKSPVRAQLVLRTATHADFDRLVFEGPARPSYKIFREGAKVRVVFDTAAAVNLKQKDIPRARSFAAEEKKTANAKTLTVAFEVNPSAIVKDSVKGKAVIVDVSGPLLTAAKEASPKGDAPASPAEQAVPAASEKTGQQEGSAQKAGETPALEVVSGSETKAEKAELAGSSPPATESAKSADVPEAAPPSSEVPPEGGPVLAASFDPKMQVGAVAFVRGGYATIVFDRKIAMDTSALTAATPSPLKLEPVDLPRNNGFRFPVASEQDIYATRDNTAWKIFLRKKAEESAISTNFMAQPDFALGARVLLPVTGAPEPVRYTDPVVGDELVLVPLPHVSAFSIGRRYADFLVLPAAQGLVVKPLHEKVIVRSFAEGIEVTANKGLRLSPASDTGVSQQEGKPIRGSTDSRSFFDFSLWKGRPEETFTEARQKRVQTVVDVPRSQRNLARLDLARFYFAHGMGKETLALLTLLSRESPELASHPEFLALRGGASILSGHAQEGLNDLNHPELKNNPEMMLWQAAGLALMRDWASAEEKFNRTETLLAVYPEPFRSRFSVLAVESAVGTGKDREATEWLGRLETEPHLPDIDPAIKYLRGVLQSKAGRIEAAEKLWRDVARSGDRLYKIRAELALIDLRVATRSLTPVQAAERLEGLRYAWRGDDLELDILRRLGDFYIEGGNFKSGLAVLAQASRLYPNSPLTIPVRAEMVKAFHDLFLTEKGGKLSPVEVLTLYQTYPDLVPKGEEGNAVKSSLAERLVAVDLLDQAAGLLEEQIKNGLKAEDKVRTGARLAAIRLLDHKPDAALEALEASKADLPSGPAAAELEGKRQMLRARAYSEKGKNDDAMALLQNMTGKDAMLLKADITMRAQRWAEAAKVLQDLIGKPPQPGELLTGEQAQWLVNCAIALSLANDLPGLDRLAIDFGAAMAGTDQRDTFRVLTRPDKIGQMRDIAAAQARIAEVDMFRGFLDAYRLDPKAPGKEEQTKKK